MLEYFIGELIVVKCKKDNTYSQEVESFYQEARHKNLEDIWRCILFYEDNFSCLRRLCLKIGLSREPSRLVGYKIRLEELLKEVEPKISDSENC